MSAPIGPHTAAAPVTERQLEVLQIIGRSLDERGFPPTYAEIVKALGLSPHSKQVVFEHLTRLELKGMIIRYAGCARAITLTAAGRELLARRATIGATECPTPTNAT
jgi:repressor LexA